MENKTVIYGDAIIKPRSDTYENWRTINPILLSGEPGVVTGLNVAGDGLCRADERVKIGDGIHNWKDLPWWKGPIGPQGEQGIQGEKGEQGIQGEKGEQGIQGEKGEQGEKGDSYILTDSDKQEIADMVDTENFDLSEYVKNTDYATTTTCGVVKATQYHGLKINNGDMEILPAYETEIEEKKQFYKPITPLFLDLAVKVGLTTNKETLTDEEKAKACEWLGVNALAIPDIVSGGGKSISVNDVSPLAHTCSCRLTSDTYDELVGSLNNILNYNENNIFCVTLSGDNDVNSEWAGIFTDNKDGSFIFNGTVPEYDGFKFIVKFDNLQDGETYTVSIRNSKNEAIGFEVDGWVIDDGGTLVSYGEHTTHYTFTKNEDTSYYRLVYTFDKNMFGGTHTFDNEILYVQIEKGEVMSDWVPAGNVYETVPYIEDFSTVKVNVGGKSYTPNADGTVTGIVSVSPIMEITTDNEHANIHDFTYCVDTRTYIDRKFEELKLELQGG